MKLIIDIGNTRMKIALFEADVLVNILIVEDISADQLDQLITLWNGKWPEYSPINKSIISAVRNYPQEIKKILDQRVQLFELAVNLPLPVKLNYKTLATLGKDRIAIAVAAMNSFPDKNVLVIGAGTCITYDFVNKKKEYLGGGISPGIIMRYKALNTFTGQLPLIGRIDQADLIGNSTEDSMRSGVLNGALAEVNGIIEKYKHRFPELKIILTGGDANYFDKNLKNNIFANSNLVLEGLNMILDYNVGD